MIPKIVHYTWIGGTKPDYVIKNIKNWKKLLPDYKFIEWNENNWNIDENNFANYFYSKGKSGFAFVSDAMRVDVLDQYGGIYMDTDVHLYKSFNTFLNEEFVLGRIYNNAIGTATIMSAKNNDSIHDLNVFYKNFDISKLEDKKFDIINNGIFTRYILKKNIGMKFNNKKQRLEDDTLLLPKQYFEIPRFMFEKGGYAVHEQVGSWSFKSKTPSNSKIKNNVKKIIKNISPALMPRYQSIKSAKNNSIAKEYSNKGL